MDELRESSSSRRKQISIGLLGQVYDLPRIRPSKTLNRTAKISEVPAYSDGEGKIYAFDYSEIPQMKKYFQQVVGHLPIPKPRDFTSYQDYEYALLKWERKITQKLGDLMLPDILGRFFSRPNVASGVEELYTEENSATGHVNTSEVPLIDDYSGKDHSASGKDASGKELSASGKEQSELFPSEEMSESQSTTSPKVPTHKEVRSTRPLFPTLVESSPRDPSVTSGEESSKEGGRGDTLVGDGGGSIQKRLGLTTLTFDCERWEANLVPVEPDPLAYATYEEYAVAMQAWASVSSESIKFIPPHSQQLRKILPITVPQESGTIDPYKWLPASLSLNAVRLGLLEYHPFFETFKKQKSQKDFKLKAVLAPRKILPQDSTLDNDTLNNIDKYFTLWLSHQVRATLKQGNGKFNIYIHDAYGNTHMTLVPPRGGLITEEGEVKEGKGYLRRTAINPALEREASSKPKVGDKIRAVPIFDIPIVEEKLLVDEEYTNKVILEFQQQVQHRYRNHDLYAWYNPNKFDPKYVEQESSLLKQSLEKRDQLNHDEIMNILLLPVHPDIFLNIIEPSEEVPLLGSKNQNLQGFSLLAKKFDFTQLGALLDLVQCAHTQRALLARISLFILDALRNNFSLNVLLNTWMKLDLEKMCILPYLLHFFDPISRDIFPYKKDHFLLMKQALLSPLQVQEDAEIQPLEPDPECQKFQKDITRFVEKHWDNISPNIKNQLLDGAVFTNMTVQSAPSKNSGDVSTKCTISAERTSPTEIAYDLFQQFEKPSFRLELLKLWKQEGFHVEVEYSKTQGVRPSSVTVTYLFRFSFNRVVRKYTEREIQEKKTDFDNLIVQFYKMYIIFETKGALRSNKYGEACQLLTKEFKTLANEVLSILKKDPFFLSSSLQLIGHRSSLVSSLFLFMNIQFMKWPETMHVYLDPRAKLYPLIRTLASSKLRHVKTAARRLLAFIIENHSEDFKRYLKYNNQFLVILFDKAPILSEAVVDVVIQDLRKYMSGQTEPLEPSSKTEANYSREKMSNGWWIDDSSFHDLLNNLKTSCETASIDGARILSVMAKAIWIEKSKETKESKKSERNGPISVKVEKEDLQTLLNCLPTTSGTTENMTAHHVQILTYVLTTLRHFIKLPEYFSQIDNTQLYNVSPFLNHTDPHLNRESWRTLYQCMKYNAGIIETWITDTKGVRLFLGPLNVGSELNAIENGLHYVSKLFSMPPRTKKGGKVDKKSVEADAKSLAGYFLMQRSFINVHMIYQNLNKKSPGGPFHEISKFFYLLLTQPALSKLLKDCQKNVQYKGDIDEITEVMNLSSEKQTTKKAKDQVIWE